MLYSFPVSPSVLFGAPCWVVITRHGILFEKNNNKNNKKKIFIGRAGESANKNENNNKLPYCGTPRKASRLLFGMYRRCVLVCRCFGMPLRHVAG